MKITDFLVLDSDGEEIVAADPFGNNIAFVCAACGHAVLATALENQRGSDEAHPVACRGCGRQHFLDVRTSAQKIYIHEV